MPSTKLLNGLPHDLLQSYMSTLCYHKKGYMADWIFNGAKIKGIHEISIDVMTEQITPQLMNILPLKYFLRQVKAVITANLLANRFNNDFIISATLYFKIPNFESPTIYCRSEVIDLNGKSYISKILEEKAYEPYFNVFLESGSNGIINIIRRKLQSFKMKGL